MSDSEWEFRVGGSDGAQVLDVVIEAIEVLAPVVAPLEGVTFLGGIIMRGR
jgi:hypothetical protein